MGTDKIMVNDYPNLKHWKYIKNLCYALRKAGFFVLLGGDYEIIELTIIKAK